MTTLSAPLPTTGTSLRAGDTELPLESVRIDAVVDGVGVVWTVVQTFVNTLDEAMEAVYTFPLPNSGAVNRATMHIGGRAIEAEIKERESAQVEYEEALAKGHTAMLLEQHAGEIFETAVGNIHPGEAISIEIVVHATVVRDGNEATVRFPTLIKERYVPEGTPNAEALTPPRHAGDVHVNSTVSITFTAAVDELVCTTVEGASVTPSHVTIGDFSLDRDIVLKWNATNEVMDAKWTADSDNPTLGTLEVVVRTVETPTTKTNTRRAVSVLIDRSGSMGGWNMDAAIRIANDVIGTLTRDDLVHVLTFDSDTEVLEATAHGFAPATAEIRDRLCREIASIYARGGTELDGAIEVAGAAIAQLEDREDANEFERVVLLITDGAYGDEATAARQRDVQLRNARVIVVGIGQELNGYLETLAANGWFVGVEAAHVVGDVAKKVCERIGQPAYRNARIDMPGLSDQAPHLAPDIYPNATVTLWARAPRPATGAVVHIETDAGTLAVVVVRVCEDASATTRWAKARINALDYDVMTDRIDESAGRTAIIELSVRHRILSKYTAWLAVDRSRSTDTIIPSLVVQPSPLHDFHRFAPSPMRSVAFFCFDSSTPRMSKDDRVLAQRTFARLRSPSRPQVVSGPPITNPIDDLVAVLTTLKGLLEVPELDIDAVADAVVAVAEWLIDNEPKDIGRRLHRKLLTRTAKLMANPFPQHGIAWRIVNEMIDACPKIRPSIEWSQTAEDEPF
ncbi:MAG: VIT domain-containing protein [Actinomycetota bacterium]